MKRLIPLFSLIILSSLVFGQSTTPRFGLTNGRQVAYTQTYLSQNLTDGSSVTDTVLIHPNADQNWYYINTGDTLNGRVCIAIVDTTVQGRANVKSTDNDCYRYDRMFIAFKVGGGKNDTLDFYGSIQVDSSGSASNKRLNIKKDATKLYYIIPFVFNGITWVQLSQQGSGLGGSMSTNR
jgi:hypothetical protein